MLRKNDHTSSQKAMQTWCLARTFPFLVFHKVPLGDTHMEFLLYLLRVMEIVFAPKVTRSLMAYLDALVKDFQRKFKELFPAINPINKFHHMDHYSEGILWSGPLPVIGVCVTRPNIVN